MGAGSCRIDDKTSREVEFISTATFAVELA
jgi:hypothetical protein